MAYIGQRPVIGRYIKLDQISSGFNGSNTGFSMTAGSQAVFPGTARNLLLSLGGVIQEPDTDFTISGSTLTFTTPPVANTTFFGVIYGDMQATGTPSDGTVLPASIASSGHFKIPQLTVNEDGADVDFRVEGDTDANLLFADASADKVGIGVSNPGSKLHIDGGNVTNSVEIHGTGGHELYSYHDSGGVGWATGTGGTYGELLYLDESGSTARLYTGGTERFRVSGTEAVVNETGASVDFRVEGDTSTHLLFADASTDRVGIGTSSPSTIFVVSNAGAEGLEVSHSSGTVELSAYNRSGSARSPVDIIGQTFKVLTGNPSLNNGLFQDSSGKIGIGTDSPGSLLTLNHATNPAIQFQDSGTKVASINAEGSETNIASFEGKALVFATSSSSSFVEQMRITTGGVVQIGGETANNADIDTSNSKLTIKQSANSQEDGIYIERSGERRGFYIYMGGALGVSDGLCFTTNQLGGDTDVLAIDRGGDVKIGAGNLKFNTAGKGIDFSATTDASGMTSELLDDYEEGTYAPALLGSTTNPTVNYTNQQGRYTKIGNLVYATFDLTYDSKSADGSGILYVSFTFECQWCFCFSCCSFKRFKVYCVSYNSN